MHTSSARQGMKSIVTCLGLLLAACATSTLHGDDPPLSVGDQVVTTGPASLKVGDQVLLTVPGGSALAVKKLRDGWIGVDIEHEGRSLAGWVSVRHVTCQPATLFLSLTVGYESEVDRAHEDFQRIDKNTDSHLDADEFIVGTRKETLEDLNRTLRQIAGTKPGSPIETLTAMNRLMAAMGNHRYWNRQLTFDELSQLVDDFHRTRDLRQSKLARSLVHSESAAATSTKAQAMFVWADRDRDGKLSLQEFRHALPANRNSHDATPAQQLDDHAETGSPDQSQAAAVVSRPASAARLTTAMMALLKPNVADSNTVTLALWFSAPITEANIEQLDRLANILANQQVVILDLVSNDASQRESLAKVVSAQPNVVLLETPQGRVARKRAVHADSRTIPPLVDAVLFIGFLNAESTTTAANESSPASNVLNKSFVSVCEAGKDAYVFAGSHQWDMVAGRSEEPLHVGAVANQSSRVAWYSRNAGGDDLAGFIQAIRTRASAGGQISPEQ